MSLLPMLIQYKAAVAYGLVVSTVTVGVGVHEAQNDTGLFGLAPVPRPTVYFSPTATPTKTEIRVMTPSPSISVITGSATPAASPSPGPTVLPSPATTETLIVPLPVPVLTTVVVSSTVTATPTPTATPSPTQTYRNHANGLGCFIIVEVDNHGNVIKRPCPKETP